LHNKEKFGDKPGKKARYGSGEKGRESFPKEGTVGGKKTQVIGVSSHWDSAGGREVDPKKRPRARKGNFLQRILQKQRIKPRRDNPEN